MSERRGEKAQVRDLATEVIGADYPDAYLYVGSGDDCVLLCDHNAPKWRNAVVLTSDNARRLAADLIRMADQSESECTTCSGRGVWMDEPCPDCAPFLCYPCARGDHDEHRLAWVPDITCECPECVTPPVKGGGNRG